MKLRFEHPALKRLAPAWAAQLVRGWLRTCPVKVKFAPEAKELLLSGRPAIYATWHCHLLAPLYFSRKYYLHQLTPVLMASPSRDGEFIAAVARHLDFLVFLGSRHKGGVKALQTIAGYLRQGHIAGVVADGSRGPARVAQKGLIFLAREAQAPIIPLAVAARRKITFNTWDRFELPLPFSPLAILAGEPLWVRPEARGAALEDARRELETSLNTLFHLSQDYFSPVKKF